MSAAAAARPLRVGMICYPSVGGSGVVATELGKHLAQRGHQVHFISSDVPFRLTEFHENVSFHAVDQPMYPVFREPQYLLAMTNKIVDVVREYHLDILHAHYAIPHATCAYLARQILAASGLGAGVSTGTPAALPKVITTLHGTDITLMGSDPSFREAIAFSINASDGVTAVSQHLARETEQELSLTQPIRVIYNFLDCNLHKRVDAARLRVRYARPDEQLVIHISNFRTVKRLDLVVEVFRRIRREVNARLLLVGDGPEWGATRKMVAEAGLCPYVHFLGKQDQVVDLLSASDLFLLPSEQESFGLAALEAMACEVPVVASNVGGLPEVIEHVKNGFLHPLDDVEGMAASSLAVLKDAEAHRRVATAARRRVEEAFCATRIVPIYEAYYREILGAPA